MQVSSRLRRITVPTIPQILAKGLRASPRNFASTIHFPIHPRLDAFPLEADRRVWYLKEIFQAGHEAHQALTAPAGIGQDDTTGHILPQQLAADNMRPARHETLTRPSTWATRLMQTNNLSSPFIGHNPA